MKYKIHYFFDGFGHVIVDAKNEADARVKFFNGEFDEEEHESGENYCIETVEKVKK